MKNTVMVEFDDKATVVLTGVTKAQFDELWKGLGDAPWTRFHDAETGGSTLVQWSKVRRVVYE